MNYRSLHFQKQKATILRSNYMVDITTIRDLILTDYSIVKDKVNIFIEASGGQVQRNHMIGMIMVDVYTAYVPGGTPILTGDVLLVEGIYYEVGALDNFSRNGYEIKLTITLKNLQRS